jgi:alpha-galactosidase
MTRLHTAALLFFGAITPGHATPSSVPEGPVQVFVLAGQSNMEGKAKVTLLERQLEQPGTSEQFAHLRDGDGWAEREDVWIEFLGRRGKLTVGYGSPGCIGPELEFGNVVGDRIDEQVLIIKTAWGGKSLYRDFRPPSAGLPPDEKLEALHGNQRKKRPETTMEDVQASFGAYYRSMLTEVADTLEHLGERFPKYGDRGWELAGFVWFQGWNDMVDAEATAEYAENMAHFVRDVRRDLGAPDLPFVIGQLGVGGTGKQDAKREAFKAAQAAAEELPEFAGSLIVVRTDEFWDDAAQEVFDKGWKEHLDEWNAVGSDYPYHYLGSVKTYSAIGAAFGEAILELRAAREEAR